MLSIFKKKNKRKFEVNRLKIELNCGRELNVNNFNFGYTYGGMLEGLPNIFGNRIIFGRFTYPTNWGERKVLKLEPTKKEFITELKPCHYAVWLYTNEPLNSGFCGSELVVLWYDDYPDGKTIKEIIQKGVQDIDWNGNAEDFDY